MSGHQNPALGRKCGAFTAGVCGDDPSDGRAFRFSDDPGRIRQWKIRVDVEQLQRRPPRGPVQDQMNAESCFGSHGVDCFA